MGCDPKGFDYYHIYNDQGQYWNPQYRGTDTPEGKYIVEEGYSTDLSTDHAIDFMDHRDKSKPFCLMLHHKAPHRNWQANIKYLGKYDNVNFPMPETFYDDYATRGEAVRTQKMSVTKHMRWEQDFKVPEMLDMNNEDSKDSYNALMGEINRMTPAQRSAWGRYYFPRNRKLLEANLKGKELDNWKYQAYIRDYMSVIASVDESVGRVLDYLDQNGLTDNTIIVYTSDQGFYMGEHGWFDKRFMYEESMHTPLLMRLPSGYARRGRVEEMVQNIDYAPTFLEMAGVEIPSDIQGISLVPLVKEDKVPRQWRKQLYYHFYEYPAEHTVKRHYGVRTDRYKLIHFYNDIDAWELYDLQTDPMEMHNVYDDRSYAKIRKKKHKQLGQLQSEDEVEER